MAKEIMTQATNRVNIIGKLVSVSHREGKTTTGKNYVSGNLIVRTEQSYFGNDELSEISVSFFSTALTNKGTVNPAYENIQKLREFKTVQNVGLDEADTIRITGASLAENMFIAKASNQLVDTWTVKASFFNKGNSPEVASYCVDAFIFDKHPEVDREGEETGRVIVKGGIVQYGGVLDIVEFIAEDSMVVDHITRNWEDNSTVQIKGRIRAVTKEDNRATAQSSSWGEAIPEPNSTRVVRELIITGGSDEPYDEEFGYDPTDIRKAFAERKARIEELRMDKAPKAVKPVEPAKKKLTYTWEE